MAMRTAFMNQADVTPRIRKPRHLLRKLVLLVLLSAAYALGLVMLFFKVSWFPTILFSYFATCIVAIIGGFGTRLLLANRFWLIRSIAAVLMPLVGLAVQGYFTDWEIGIDVIALSQGYISWEDLIHLVVGISGSWASLWAWQRPTLEVETSTDVEPVHLVAPSQLHSISPRNWPLQPRLRIGSRAGFQPGNGSGPSVRARAKFVTKQPTRPKRSRSALLNRAHVQLAVVEEHRCPYCLELVSRSDAGGVKECEVCHSLHHADCWAITDTCQVPHLNT